MNDDEKETKVSISGELESEGEMSVNLPTPPQPVTDQEAQEWAELCQRATPGPWEIHEQPCQISDGCDFIPLVFSLSDIRVIVDCECGHGSRDAAFIAAAREALPRLLVERNALKLRLRVLELEREQDNAALLLSTWDNQDAEKLLHQAISCLEDMVWQFASRIESNGQLYLNDSGLSALESAFDVLGWESPHAVDPVGLQCEHAECTDWSAGATIMPDNMYVQLCSEHLRHAEKTVYPVKDWAKNRESWRDENNVLLPGWMYDRPRG